MISSMRVLRSDSLVTSNIEGYRFIFDDLNKVLLLNESITNLGNPIPLSVIVILSYCCD